jgi:monoamine oxidase
MNKRFDVLILGAGAAGLMAARELAGAGLQVGVLEARNRVGGRVCTVQDGGARELGAEFIHGEGRLSKELLRSSGNGSSAAGGSIWQYQNGRLQQSEDFIDDWKGLLAALKEVDRDIPVQQFLDSYLMGPLWERTREQVSRYAEGYYAADLRSASTFALREELQAADHEADERPFTGYGPLLEHLYRQCLESASTFFLDTAATAIEWSAGSVVVHTEGQSFQSQKLLYTLPIGVWRAGKVTWTPALEHKAAAVEALGYGPALKIVLNFRRRFWEDASLGNTSAELGFLFSEERIPTWWAGAAEQGNVLSGWKAGPSAMALAQMDQEEILHSALSSLSRIFSVPTEKLKELLESHHYHNWITDPWTLGGYSFQVVNGGRYQEVAAAPVANTLFFAGEGLYDGPIIGTVEAALETGLKAARAIIAGASASNQAPAP